MGLVNLEFVSVKDVEKVSGKSETLVVGFCKDSDSSKSKVGLSLTIKGSKFSGLTGLLEKRFKFEAGHGSQLYFADLSDSLRGEVISHDSFLAVGAGSSKDNHSEALLDLGGKIAQTLKKHKVSSVDIYVDSFHVPASTKGKDHPVDFAGRPMPGGAANLETVLEMLSTGVRLGLYSFEQYKTKSKDQKKPEAYKLRFISTKIASAQGNSIIKRVSELCEAVSLTRDLQNLPACDLYPELLAKKAQALGKSHGFGVKVFDEKKLKTEGFEGIIAVGRGSVRPPRLIVMEHNMSKKNAPLLVLVGKGVTFDTGGVCLKPAGGMEAMKRDMSGAASVLGAMVAIAKLKLPIRVLGMIAAAENMNSGSAVLPGDIYTAHGGKTVEVINTDAEGRLILADVLSYAKEFKPNCVVDVATLTGAVLIALGGTATGIMGNSGVALDAVKKASALAGERVWELPLYEQYANDMKSSIADIKNIGSSRNAGSQKGGAFLNYFVDDAYPWVHMDIAGTSDTASEQGAHCIKDSGTGVPVRTLVALAENFQDLI